MLSIPKATNPQHIKENHAALELQLTEEDFKQIERTFKPPNRKTPSAMK